jgi:hypothetical protein
MSGAFLTHIRRILYINKPYFNCYEKYVEHLYIFLNINIKTVFLPVSVIFFLAGDGKNSTPLRVNIIY